MRDFLVFVVFQTLAILSVWKVASVSSFHVPSLIAVSSSRYARSRSTRKVGFLVSDTNTVHYMSTLYSDIPREDDLLEPPPPVEVSRTKKGRFNGESGNNNDENPRLKNVFADQQRQQTQHRWYSNFVPPPPEDQFIMTGDLCVLFFYAFTSHFFNDYIVNSVLHRNDITVLQAVHSLDPTGELVNTQIPSWVQTQNQLAVDNFLSVNAQETLLNHWGPLFSTEGSASVALCTCWLIAGWLHRAFLFQNSIDCTTGRALSKTVETWLSTCVLMTALAMAANALVEHIPVLQTLLCVQCAAAQAAISAATGMDGTIDASSNEMLLGSAATTTSSVLALTKADTVFLVDSVTVLIAWRFIANKMLNMFR